MKYLGFFFTNLITELIYFLVVRVINICPEEGYFVLKFAADIFLTILITQYIVSELNKLIYVAREILQWYNSLCIAASHTLDIAHGLCVVRSVALYDLSRVPYI